VSSVLSERLGEGLCAVDDVAAAFVAALGELTALRLANLLYFAQATHLALYGTPLFEDEIQASRDGPVVARLYDRHGGNHQNRAGRNVNARACGDADRLSVAGRAVVGAVARRYGQLSGEELADIARRQEPWRVTRGDLPPQAHSERTIPTELMRAFAAAQTEVSEQAVVSVAASARLEGVDLDATTIGYLHDVAERRLSADEIVARLVAARP
jgi:uncharacterized phage-associated protein